MRQLSNDQHTLEASVHEVIEQNLCIFVAEYALLSSNRALQTILPKALVSQFSEQKDGKRRPDLLHLSRYKERHLLIEFKRIAETLNWADKAQAEGYRGLSQSYVGPIDIIVIGGKRIKEMSQVQEGGTIRMLTYIEIISQAECELKWLLNELSLDGK